MNENLQEIRQEIDKVDSSLIALIGKRVELIKEVLRIKQELKMPILQASREEEIIRKVSQQSRYPSQTIEIFKAIIEESKKLQRKLILEQSQH